MLLLAAHGTFCDVLLGILQISDVGGKSIQKNWRSTHLKNGANDVVIVPNTAIAKMRILNHSAGSRSYGESLTASVDNRNERSIPP